MRSSLLALVAALSLGALSAPAHAGDDPGAVVKYRQLVMGAVGRHMGASSMIKKGAIGQQDDLVGHAQALHELSLMIPGLWPEGTAVGDKYKTEAKAEIWSKAADFQAAVKANQQATAKLVEAAKSGDMAAYGAAFGQVGKSCGGCHDTFRVEHEH